MSGSTTTVDVVVIGYGPAGAAAALGAHAAGADVLVLESGGHGGGNALYSGGFLFDVPGAAGVAHLDALCFGRTDRDVLVAYADGLHDLAGWLAGIGAATERFEPPPFRLPAPFPSWPAFPGGASIEYRVVSGGDGRRGAQLWQRLDDAVREREITVRFGTEVTDLVLDGGRVTGVVSAGGDTVLARGGVVLACGGFEADPGLADTFLPLASGAPVGHGRNIGAGLRLAERAGASLWHMYGFFGWFAFTAPDHESAFAIDFFAPGHLYVDADGHRFADETGFEVHDRLRALSTYLPRNPNRPRLPAWAIFDEPTRRAGPLNGLLGTPNDYTWSLDNSAEIERGWIVRADDVPALGQRIGVDAVVLAATLAEYDAAARAGNDPRFGRSADTLVPLAPGPLYAIETRPGVAGTTGGPRHDAAARVLRRDGTAVPGLYAAGGVSMVWGHLIDHGGGLTDALVFGRIAGAQAAGGVGR
jgi:succinate dehydrogenase/fumarate reductase flavoprotein subunit